MACPLCKSNLCTLGWALVHVACLLHDIGKGFHGDHSPTEEEGQLVTTAIENQLKS